MSAVGVLFWICLGAGAGCFNQGNLNSFDSS